MPKPPSRPLNAAAPRAQAEVAVAAPAKRAPKPKPKPKPIAARPLLPQLSAEQLQALPASERIRWRLVNAGQRHHANDNISAFMQEGELAELKAEVQAKMQDLLQALVIDTASDHNTQDTARRVAKMYLDEVFGGRYRAAPSVTEFPNVARLNELLIVGPITVRSACSHHFCPILGKVWIGVLPKEGSNLIGLSKYARMTEWVMSRPQIQEEAVIMLANELESRMKPSGLAIVMEADHFCMHWRGVKDNQSAMVNSVMRGAFLRDGNLRREFLALLPRKAS
jgi:GTP cyclohydrolase IA